MKLTFCPVALVQIHGARKIALGLQAASLIIEEGIVCSKIGGVNTKEEKDKRSAVTVAD